MATDVKVLLIADGVLTVLGIVVLKAIHWYYKRDLDKLSKEVSADIETVTRMRVELEDAIATSLRIDRKDPFGQAKKQARPS